MMKKVNVLVVDDSAFMRKMISNILEDHARLHVIDTARNGQDALEKIKQHQPDVITLDIEMPVMDGIAALKEIMANDPRPVVMLSSLTREGADKTLESMEFGAVDFIPKPSGSISLNIQDIEDEIISKVLEAAEVEVKTLKRDMPALPIKKLVPRPERASTRPTKPLGDQPDPFKKIVAIGTSTGGPRALQQVITQLPEDLKAPVVVVQHMPPGFTKSLADRLNQLSKVTVKEAEDGDMLHPGVCYIAPGGFQMRVKKSSKGFRVSISKEENRNGHQPAVDVLFESLAELKGMELISVIMTGMGSDGTNGMIQMKEQHPFTQSISESKETCVVYGMPQAAEKTKLVDFVEPLTLISERIVKLV